MTAESPLTVTLSNQQMRKIAHLLVQHKAVILGAAVELKTEDGARVKVDNYGNVKWIRRDD